MKSICNKINISFFLILLIFLSFISGLFKEILSFLLVVAVHELGHVFISIILKWKIDKIKFSLCGGVILYKEVIDKPFKEEFLIAIFGFVFQILLQFIIIFLMKNNYITSDLYNMITKYNLSILLFNLLIIYPLDGFKLVNLFLSLFLSYKKTLIFTCFISLINIILLIVYFIIFDIKLEFSYVMILSFLLKNIIKLYKEIPYLFNKFLFERYAFPLENKKYIKINKIDDFKRQKKHIIIFKNKAYLEHKVLSKIFD